MLARPRRQNKTFSELATKTWNSSVGFSGYDSVEKTVNGVRVSYDPTKSFAVNPATGVETADHKKRRKYRNSWRRQLADFFFGNFTGMRNDTKKDDIGATMGKNMVWWPEADAPTWQRVIQFIGFGLGIVTLITPAWVLYSLVRNIVMNSAKVVFKFLPELAVRGFTELQKRIKDEKDHGKHGDFMSFLLDAADWGLAVLKAPFQLARFISGAVLTPIDNARLAYKNAGIIGAVGSVAVTAILYAIFLPIVAAAVAKYVPSFFSETVAPWFANTVTPYLLAKAPWLVAAANSVGNFFAPVVTWISTAYSSLSVSVSTALDWLFANTFGLTNITSTLAFMFNYGVSTMASSMGLAISTQLIGLGAALAIGITTLGTPVTRLYHFVVNKLINLSLDPVAVPAVPAVQPAPPPGSKAELRAQLTQEHLDHQQTSNNLRALTDRVNTALNPAHPGSTAYQLAQLDGTTHALGLRADGFLRTATDLTTRVDAATRLANDADGKAMAAQNGVQNVNKALRETIAPALGKAAAKEDLGQAEDRVQALETDMRTLRRTNPALFVTRPPTPHPVAAAQAASAVPPSATNDPAGVSAANAANPPKLI